jgi:hypothetical protein
MKFDLFLAVKFQQLDPLIPVQYCATVGLEATSLL